MQYIATRKSVKGGLLFHMFTSKCPERHGISEDINSPLDLRRLLEGLLSSELVRRREVDVVSSSLRFKNALVVFIYKHMSHMTKRCRIGNHVLKAISDMCSIRVVLEAYRS